MLRKGTAVKGTQASPIVGLIPGSKTGEFAPGSCGVKDNLMLLKGNVGPDCSRGSSVDLLKSCQSPSSSEYLPFSFFTQNSQIYANKIKEGNDVQSLLYE